MSGRAVWVAAAFALIGLAIVAGAVQSGQPISIGSLLGVLLLLSAALRFEIARRG